MYVHMYLYVCVYLYVCGLRLPLSERLWVYVVWDLQMVRCAGEVVDRWSLILYIHLNFLVLSRARARSLLSAGLRVNEDPKP